MGKWKQCKNQASRDCAYRRCVYCCPVNRGLVKGRTHCGAEKHSVGVYEQKRRVREQINEIFDQLGEKVSLGPASLICEYANDLEFPIEFLELYKR